MQQQHVRYILDRLPGTLPVIEVDEEVIDELVRLEGSGRRERADGSIRQIAATTLLKRLSTLRRALKLQKRKRVIDRLPEFPEILADYRPDMKFIETHAEAQTIAALLPPHRARWFWLALWTGQHSSDVERMTKADMQPFGAADRWVRVRNTKNRRFTGMRVACPAELAKMFRHLWLKLPTRAPLVEPWPHVSSQLPDVCERAGLPRYTAKSLRHTFFTWMISRVGITKAVMEIGGWSSYEMVVKVYGHALPAQFRDAVRALDHFVIEEARRPPQRSPQLTGLPASGDAEEEGSAPPGVTSVGEGGLSVHPGIAVWRDGSVEHAGGTPQRSVGAERIELSTNGLRVSVPPPLPLSNRLSPLTAGNAWDPTTTG